MRKTGSIRSFVICSDLMGSQALDVLGRMRKTGSIRSSDSVEEDVLGLVKPQPGLLSQPQLPQPQPQPQPQFPSRPQHQLELRSQPQLQYSSGYPPPPWAATPGYCSNPNPVSRPYA
ncbi:unnamed protein product [Fraxinus pennsylvanica]|uniref:Uncharacterized protein n=1 Tax=Fraxinus pennsylvanica TaxID=56036 RepID=A0AAD2ABR3_9LAMI|nr:unnamed protein product [Fraxinus pennsylvanica]